MNTLDMFVQGVCLHWSLGDASHRVDICHRLLDLGDKQIFQWIRNSFDFEKDSSMRLAFGLARFVSVRINITVIASWCLSCLKLNELESVFELGLN